MDVSGRKQPAPCSNESKIRGKFFGMIKQEGNSKQARLDKESACVLEDGTK
jgi:hypothetical protein